MEIQGGSALSQPLLSSPPGVEDGTAASGSVRRTSTHRVLGITCIATVVAAVCIAVGCWLSSLRPAETGVLLGCGAKAECLKIIDDYFEKATRQSYAEGGAGLLQTYGPGSIGGGSCGDEKCKLVEPCPNYVLAPHCRFDVYDNALAAIYLSKRGKLDEARNVLDAFISLLYPTGNVTPGLDYGAGALLPSQRSLTLLAAGYTDMRATAGEYQGVGVADGAVDTGNNAWVGMAFAHYAAASGDACYSLVAHDVLAALAKSTQCLDELQGFGSRLAPFPQFYRSTEHNIDMFALSHMLGAAGAMSEVAAGGFVRGMWARLADFKRAYAVGTGAAKQCDATVPAAPAAVDAQFWNLLANADPDPERKHISMAFAVQEAREEQPADGLWATDTDLIGNASGAGRGAVLQGVRFTAWGNGVQWENTASAAMAMAYYQQHYTDPKRKLPVDLTARINAARDSLKHLLAVYGSIPASVLGGNIAAYTAGDRTSSYPGGSDTGIGWTYLRYPHAASTAWTGLLLLYQFDESESISEGANPFAPPDRTVPDPHGAANRQCLPKAAMAPEQTPSRTGGGDGACSAHPGCAGLHLTGECCPTKEGMQLGCCSDAAAPPAPPPRGQAQGSGGEGAGEEAAPPRGGPGGQGTSRVAVCAANSGCARLGLTGSCCPTAEGTMLGCC